jgi:hypothetical protein
MTRRNQVIAKDEGLIWFFRRNRVGRFVPAPDVKYPEGFKRREAREVLRDLEAGEYDHYGSPAGAEYIACECQFVKTDL